jgi:hypothetical protein
MNHFVTPVTIANGQALSSIIVCKGLKLAGIIMPATWDAAAITLQAGMDGVTFQDVYDKSGAEVSITVAAGKCTMMDPAPLQAACYLRIRSGTGAAPVNQTAQRTVNLILVD